MFLKLVIIYISQTLADLKRLFWQSVIDIDLSYLMITSLLIRSTYSDNTNAFLI